MKIPALGQHTPHRSESPITTPSPQGPKYATFGRTVQPGRAHGRRDSVLEAMFQAAVSLCGAAWVSVKAQSIQPEKRRLDLRQGTRQNQRSGAPGLRGTGPAKRLHLPVKSLRPLLAVSIGNRFLTANLIRLGFDSWRSWW